MPEIVSCPLCGNRRSTPYAMRNRENYPHVSRSFCRECRIAFSNPMATEKELRTFYSKYYDKGGFGSAQSKRKMIDLKRDWEKKKEGDRRKELASFATYYRLSRPAGKLLDVGCGLGRSLFFAGELGYDVAGLDYDDDAIRFCRDIVPRAVLVVGDLLDAHLSGESFDNIIVNHVLEHVRNPRSFVRELHRLLKPAGTLFVGTPNLEATAYRLYRLTMFLSARIPSIVDGVEHTVVFSKEGLARFITSEHFAILHHRIEGHTESFATIRNSEDGFLHKCLRVIQRFARINQVLICTKIP